MAPTSGARLGVQAPFDAIGRADIVMPYPVNSAVRGVARHLVSRVYVALLDLLSACVSATTTEPSSIARPT
jgi:hypothetical protein